MTAYRPYIFFVNGTQIHLQQNTTDGFLAVLSSGLRSGPDDKTGFSCESDNISDDFWHNVYVKSRLTTLVFQKINIEADWK